MSVRLFKSLNLIIARRYGRDNLAKVKIMMNNPVMLGMSDVLGNSSIESYLNRKGVDISIVRGTIIVTISKKDSKGVQKPCKQFDFPNDIYGKNYRNILDILITKVKAIGGWNQLADKFVSTGFIQWYEKMEQFVFSEGTWEAEIRKVVSKEEVPDSYDAYHLAADKVLRMPPGQQVARTLERMTLQDWLSRDKPDAEIVREAMVDMMLDMLKQTDPARCYEKREGYILVIKPEDRTDLLKELRKVNIAELECSKTVVSQSIEARRFEAMWRNPTGDVKPEKCTLTIGQSKKVSIQKFSCLMDGKEATADEMVHECLEKFAVFGIGDHPSDYLITRRGQLAVGANGFYLR